MKTNENCFRFILVSRAPLLMSPSLPPSLGGADGCGLPNHVDVLRVLRDAA